MKSLPHYKYNLLIANFMESINFQYYVTLEMDMSCLMYIIFAPSIERANELLSLEISPSDDINQYDVRKMIETNKKEEIRKC